MAKKKGEFDFDFDSSLVDGDLYREDFISLPSITWIGKGDEGFWTVDVHKINGNPEPYWEKADHLYGMDPAAPTTEVWKTQRLRCVPIADRSRMVVTDEAGTKHYYPPMTPPSQRVPGRLEINTQIMILVDGIADPLAIGLGAKYKTVSWSNNGYHKEYPVGVKERLQEYTKKANAQLGLSGENRLRWLCSWVIDLVPLYADGKPKYIDEQGTYVNPFQVDLRTGEPEFPRTRFVGNESFLVNQALRRELGTPWEDQWKTADSVAYSEDAQEPQEEEDNIPF